MSRSKPLESTDAELDAFFATCERLTGFNPELSAYFVEGWLTALVAGPVRPPMQEWLELMCGDAFERAFSDPPSREQAQRALLDRLLVLEDALDAEALFDKPDELRLWPLFDTWEEEDRAKMREAGVPADAIDKLGDGALWANGVVAALADLAALWQLPEDDEEVQAVMIELGDQIEGLLLDRGSDAWREFLAQYRDGNAGGPEEEPTRDQLLANACFAMQDMRVFLLDHGPRPEPRRVAPQPGRNDPCPCGSGKKYKKCHGAAAGDPA